MMMTTTIPMNSTRSDSSSGSSPEPDALAVMPGGQPDSKHSYSGSSPELESPPAPVAIASPASQASDLWSDDDDP